VCRTRGNKKRKDYGKVCERAGDHQGKFGAYVLNYGGLPSRVEKGQRWATKWGHGKKKTE